MTLPLVVSYMIPFSGSSGRQSAALNAPDAGVVAAAGGRGAGVDVRGGVVVAVRVAGVDVVDAVRAGTGAFAVGAAEGVVRVACAAFVGRTVGAAVRGAGALATAALVVAGALVVGALVTGALAAGAFAGAFLTGAFAGRSLSPIGTIRRGGALD